jgi:hypothetical protein
MEDYYANNNDISYSIKGISILYAVPNFRGMPKNEILILREFLFSHYFFP